MIIKKSLVLLLLSLPLFGNVENLTLSTALEMLKEKNLELKISRFNEQMKTYEAKAVEGQNYGKLDISLTGMRSNDAGNVFGFKLQSREATFGDFGFAEFDMSGATNPLPVAPEALNYPGARNYYQTKISYMLPIYTGGKLSEYGRITKAMQRMSKFDTQKLFNEKIFQTKKAFYDISLIQNYIYNLSKIIKNIKHLEDIISNMEKEGYAKEIDALEVQARLAEAQSMYNQAKLNRDLAYQFLSFLLNTEVKSIKKINEMAQMPKVSINDVESNNLDIQKAKLGLEITKMAIGVEEANYLPTVGAFGEYSSADNTLWNEFTDKDSYTVGVQVKWNIFNGGVDNANLEKAKVNYLKVQNQVALAKSGISLKVKKLETEILSKNADVKSYKKQLHFAKKVYENYSSRYKEGIVSITDVLIKQSKELEILLKLLTVKNERNTKIFELNSIINVGENI
jgi:outer membrane protein TolC